MKLKGTGKHLYTVNCAICHGDKGDGQGHLVEINKFPPPPSYTSEALLTKPQGQRYHSLIYGKGLMGSYATQLDNRKMVGIRICKYITKICKCINY
ncbi:MAG: cytochrome c [Chitinophagales bacterium]